MDGQADTFADEREAWVRFYTADHLEGDAAFGEVPFNLRQKPGLLCTLAAVDDEDAFRAIGAKFFRNAFFCAVSENDFCWTFKREVLHDISSLNGIFNLRMFSICCRI